MKKFIIKITWFFIFLGALVLTGLLLPPNPASRSFLYAKNKKDSLLQHVPSPRMIFVGGSNLSFGINSQMIKDSLGFNPINTGLHAKIGLIYMMQNTLPYIKSGDVVVVAPEYQQFYNTFAYGGEALLRTMGNSSWDEWKGLKKEQWVNILPFVNKYAFSVVNPTEYISPNEGDVVLFNKYGDAYTHWGQDKTEFTPYGSTSGQFNQSVIAEIVAYQKKLADEGAFLFITYPGLHKTSFENKKKAIKEIEAALKENHFKILGNPERYKMPDSLMFNTPYHLSKKGMDYRTRFLIEDFNRMKRLTPEH